MYGLIDDLQDEVRRANRWRRIALFAIGSNIGTWIALVMR
jgi:hypothetical protein